MQEMRAATRGLMRWLTPPDCARFVDLGFPSSGSRRVGTLGRAQKTLNVDLVLVWSKNSCGRPVVELEQSTKTFVAPDHTL